MPDPISLLVGCLAKGCAVVVFLRSTGIALEARGLPRPLSQPSFQAGPFRISSPSLESLGSYPVSVSSSNT